MGGGGKGGGGGGQTPAFVREGTQDLANRSQQLFDLARPLLETGTGQIAGLIRTGGPGANVPILNQAVAAQRGATQRAQAEIGGDLQRAGLTQAPRGAPGGLAQRPGIFGQRIQERLGREGNVAASAIPVRAAAPLISAASSAALGGTGAAAQGFQGALGALGTASRAGQAAAAQAAAQRRGSAVQLGRNLVGLGAVGSNLGFFDFLTRQNAAGSSAGASLFGNSASPVNFLGPPR